MANETTSYVDMLRKFGSDLGLPRVNVDKLIESHKKNIDALSQSATVAAQGAQSVAQKQREIFEAGLQEATKLAQGYQPLGKLQDNLALQTEFAKKVFEIAVKGAQESATTARQSITGATTPSVNSRTRLINARSLIIENVLGFVEIAVDWRRCIDRPLGLRRLWACHAYLPLNVNGEARSSTPAARPKSSQPYQLTGDPFALHFVNGNGSSSPHRGC